MKAKKIIYVLSLLLIIATFYIEALAVNSVTPPPNNNEFDIEQANKTFDAISIRLSTQNLSVDDLQSSIDTLEKLHDQAKECVEKTQEKLDRLKETLTKSEQTAIPEGNSSDLEYLRSKKTSYTERLASCRLFVLRSQEALTAYRDTMQKMSFYGRMQRSLPIWKIFNRNYFKRVKNINFNEVYKNTGLQKLNYEDIIILIILILLAFFIGFFIRKKCDDWFSKHETLKKISTVFVTTVSVYIIPLLIFVFISLYLTFIFLYSDPFPSILFISYIICAFILFMAVISFLLYPKKVINPLGLSSNLAKAFFIRSACLASLITLAALIIVLFQKVEVEESIVEGVRTLFITLLSLIALWFCWLLGRLKIIKHISKSFSIIFRTFIILFFLALITLEWIGFHELAFYFVTGIFLSILAFCLYWLLIKLMNVIFFAIDSNQSYLSQKFRSSLGLKPHKRLVELGLVKFVIHLFLLFYFILAIFKIWGASENLINEINLKFYHGFKFADLKVFPALVIAAIATFAFVNILGRWLSHWFAKRYQKDGESDTQVAVALLVRYISFAVALLIALLIAGVNFTGLAIIAGALSVGIGLGLQNIVNNFVSGIILLLEKPFRPGDRIVVDNVEGFVKKIRFRYTQIMTLAKEDVIVPNADMVSHQVVNYMFRDRLWRVNCAVGVAYGSNIELVKKVLIEVALEHPEVEKDEPNAPMVLFRAFGNSSLNFELWCIIRDVNKKYHVTSDLYFAIDKAFRKNKIVIAFPQRDLHIKDWNRDIELKMATKEKENANKSEEK